MITNIYCAVSIANQSILLQRHMCRGGRRSTWTWWFRSTARRSRRRIGWCHTHTSCASLLKQTGNVSLHLFPHLRRKRWKSLLLVFFLSKESANCVKKAVSVLEGKYVSIIISKNYFNAKNFKNWVKKWKWVKFSRNGFSCQTVIYPVWPICSRSIILQCLCFNTKHYQLFSLTKIKR